MQENENLIWNNLSMQSSILHCCLLYYTVIIVVYHSYINVMYCMISIWNPFCHYYSLLLLYSLQNNKFSSFSYMSKTIIVLTVCCNQIVGNISKNSTFSHRHGDSNCQMECNMVVLKASFARESLVCSFLFFHFAKHSHIYQSCSTISSLALRDK